KISRRFPGEGASALYQRFLAERPPGRQRPISVDDFAPRFEMAYAEHQDWLATRGGPTEKEIRGIAKSLGHDIDDETAEAFRELNVEEGLRNWFITQSNTSAAEWERVRDRLVIIHDEMSPDEVIETY